MGNEYKFAVAKCTRCGQSLSGEHVEVIGMKGILPMGRCPKCGTAYPLEEVKPPEPPEPEAQPAEVKKEE